MMNHRMNCVRLVIIFWLQVLVPSVVVHARIATTSVTVVGPSSPSSLSSQNPLSDHLGIQSMTAGYLTDQYGTEYELSALLPYIDLLASDRYIVADVTADDTETVTTENEFGMEPLNVAYVEDVRTGEVFPVPIYRAVYEDGTILLVETDEDGFIKYAEIHHREYGKESTIFIKTEDCQIDELFAYNSSSDASLLVIENDDVDDEDDGDENGFFFESDEDFLDEEATNIPDEGSSSSSHPPVEEVVDLPPFIYTSGDGTSSDCPYFKVIKVGIVYDAEFCTKYTNSAGARSHIMLIVATASAFYENDMCIQLQLTDIYSPDDDDCSAPSTFESFPRHRACGSGSTSETFIRYFRDWAETNRESIGFDPVSTIHAFTGFPHRGVLGCAYIGTVCQYPDYAYGVDYMTTDNLSSQGIIFAHELGHNLSARHLSGPEYDRTRYILQTSLRTPTDGFHPTTIEKIHDYLNSDVVTCDEIIFPSVPMTNVPTTMMPSNIPSAVPSKIPSTFPTFIPSIGPTIFPTLHPVTNNPTKTTRTPTNDKTDTSGCTPSQQKLTLHGPKTPKCFVTASSNDNNDINDIYGCYEMANLMTMSISFGIDDSSCTATNDDDDDKNNSDGNGNGNSFIKRNPILTSISFLSCKEKKEEEIKITNLSKYYDDEEDHGHENRRLKKQKDTSESDTITTSTMVPTSTPTSNNDSNGTETSESVSSSMTKPDVMDLSNAIENGLFLDSFFAIDCSSACLVINEYLCFHSSLKSHEQERSYIVSYSASILNGDENESNSNSPLKNQSTETIIETEIIIRNENVNNGIDDGDDDCRTIPSTICQEN